MARRDEAAWYRSAIQDVLLQGSREARPVRLNVNLANIAAIRLYESLGFRRTGRTPMQDQMEARPPVSPL